MRDTQKFHGWQWFAKGHQGPGLQDCVTKILGIPDFQAGGHNSRKDAAHTMALYLCEEAAIERQYASGTSDQEATTAPSLSAGTDSDSDERATADTSGTSPSTESPAETSLSANIRKCTACRAYASVFRVCHFAWGQPSWAQSYLVITVVEVVLHVSLVS